MKNGSVQRASKRSYMDEATLAGVTRGLSELREEIARLDSETASKVSLETLSSRVDTIATNAAQEINDISAKLSDICDAVLALSSKVADLALASTPDPVELGPASEPTDPPADFQTA